MVEPHRRAAWPRAQRLSQSSAEAVEGVRYEAARALRGIRIASVCGYRSGGGALACGGRGTRMAGEEYVPDSSEAGVVCVSFGVDHVARCGERSGAVSS